MQEAEHPPPGGDMHRTTGCLVTILLSLLISTTVHIFLLFLFLLLRLLNLTILDYCYNLTAVDYCCCSFPSSGASSKGFKMRSGVSCPPNGVLADQLKAQNKKLVCLDRVPVCYVAEDNEEMLRTSPRDPVVWK